MVTTNLLLFITALLLAATRTTGLLRLLLMACLAGGLVWYTGIRVIGPQLMPPAAEVSREAQ